MHGIHEAEAILRQLLSDWTQIVTDINEWNGMEKENLNESLTTKNHSDEQKEKEALQSNMMHQMLWSNSNIAEVSFEGYKIINISHYLFLSYSTIRMNFLVV